MGKAISSSFVLLLSPDQSGPSGANLDANPGFTLSVFLERVNLGYMLVVGTEMGPTDRKHSLVSDLRAKLYSISEIKRFKSEYIWNR